jgi:hypothetical protein
MLSVDWSGHKHKTLVLEFRCWIFMIHVDLFMNIIFEFTLNKCKISTCFCFWCYICLHFAFGMEHLCTSFTFVLWDGCVPCWMWVFDKLISWLWNFFDNLIPSNTCINIENWHYFSYIERSVHMKFIIIIIPFWSLKFLDSTILMLVHQYT